MPDRPALKSGIAWTLFGFVSGFFVLHPLSMVFQGLIHPYLRVDLGELGDAFSVHHLPMAFFFGALGALFGVMNAWYILSLAREKTRVRLLEGLLPICAHCKKIRDDSNAANGEGQWVRVDHYISSRTDTRFTHGMCPECYEKVLAEDDAVD